MAYAKKIWQKDSIAGQGCNKINWLLNKLQQTLLVSKHKGCKCTCCKERSSYPEHTPPDVFQNIPPRTHICCWMSHKSCCHHCTWRLQDIGHPEHRLKTPTHKNSTQLGCRKLFGNGFSKKCLTTRKYDKNTLRRARVFVIRITYCWQNLNRLCLFLNINFKTGYFEKKKCVIVNLV